MALVLVIAHVAIVRLALRMFEYAPPLKVDDSEADPRAEVVRFSTSQGNALAGCLFRQTHRSARGLILFCHELGADKWSAMTYCEGLFAQGYDVFAFDFRNHGESDRVSGYEPIHWLTTGEVDDARAALRYVQDRNDLKDLPLGLYGISRGGCAALALATEDPSIRCVCADSAYTTRSMTRLYARRWMTLFVPTWAANLVPLWHIDLTITIAWWISQWKRGCRYVRQERALRQLKNRPVTLISGKRDTYVLPEIAMKVYQHIGGDEATLWIVPGAKHNQARSVMTAEYDARLVEFFSQLSTADRTPDSPISTTESGGNRRSS